MMITKKKKKGNLMKDLFFKVLFTSAAIILPAINTANAASTNIFDKPQTKFQEFMDFLNAFVPHLVALAVIVGGIGLMFPKAMRLDASVWKGVIFGAIIIGSADGIASWLSK
ncbi:MAG: hypothetical protein COC22_00160 [Flavobacteriaceae bacterium]|nr:MAG: hypothetical protein COC22_00160 [Flavobacteriaceae bacterium]